MKPMTEYRSREWLVDHMTDVVAFYYPTCLDREHGGFIAQLDAETGEVYDPDAKHIVATARFVTNFWRALHLSERGWIDNGATILARDDLLEQIRRGVDILRTDFYDAEADGFHWLLRGREPVDSRRVCYAHAFVVLAFARGKQTQIPAAHDGFTIAERILRSRFYEPAVGLYRSEFDPAWADPSSYRGQNANMHACEALLAAYEATGDTSLLERAICLARRLCVDLADETDGRIWEHYTVNWEHDFEYNRQTPADQFRPWGYQPGHHTEWAKLLAILHRHREDPPDWLLPRAKALYEYAVETGWDDTHGGFYYTLDDGGDPVVDDKYGWPVAEAIGAAAALYERLNNDTYLADYDRLWRYAESTLTAPEGNWYERVSRGGSPYPTSESPTVEPGYHPVGACFEALRSLHG
jgi:mannose/cellobiose epimerase-like protein (N-acyl-D-glucosamine 2-epimerase family)